ncbi:hypothetical protein [Paraburkholderia sediminicola]|uniref:hypothetical protein n=1 Tax=Paraburkholderia sediminicola TaxID=458836 RepID=UPI0038B953C9
MKTKLQRMKSCRPSPGHLEINQWIREQQTRLGIETGGIPPVKSTVTVMLPSMVAVTRVAHAAADAKIAVDPHYAEMSAKLDAELAEILEGGVGLTHPPRRRKSALAQIEQVLPRIMPND